MPGIFSIQVLRALAAVGVVIAHIQFDLTQRAGLIDVLPSLAWGKAGVDVFFVVSGFVMVYSSERLFGAPDGPQIFITRRLSRIVPLYWLVTTIYIVIATIIPGLPHKGYTAEMTVGSYFFIPFRDQDGLMEPIVGQGWTLNYEMLFYALFALAVGLPRRAAVALVSLVMVSAVLAGRHFEPSSPVLASWSNDIILEFVLGMMLGLAYREGFRLQRSIRILLIGGGLALMYLAFAHASFATNSRAIDSGVPAAMIVAGAVLGVPTGPSAGWRWLKTIGDASYALYLLHSLPIRALRELCAWSGLDIRAAPWVYLIVALATATTTAVVAHFCIERPINGRLRAAFAPRISKKVPVLNP